MPQQTDAELIAQSDVIRNETTPLANTAGRIADMFRNIIESKPNNEAQEGQFILRDPYDASGGTYPTTGGTGTSGAIRKGNIFPLSVGGTLNGEFVPAGMWLVATEHAPGQTPAKWRAI